jgi:SAM-dependent methyltransferase
MPFQKIKSNKKVKDNVFDAIYSNGLKEVAEIHFSPIEVAKKAAQYLVQKMGDRILDIGSGAGKFCMIGSVFTDGFFTGVEQRKHLHELAKSISEIHNLSNVAFIHANIMDISFTDFDGFYCFNPFYENINPSGKMDDLVELKRTLYDDYSSHVKAQLESKPLGTKLVTYFSYLTEIPDSYRLQFSDFEGKLKMWEKIL